MSSPSPPAVNAAVLLVWLLLPEAVPASKTPSNFTAQLKARGGLCVEPVSNIAGARVHMKPCDGNPNQRWWFRGSDLLTNSGSCLTAQRGQQPTGDVVLWPCNEPRRAGQQWTYSHTEGLLQVAGHTQCLTAVAAKREFSGVFGSLCDATVVKQQWEYNSPLSSSECSPECTGLATCVYGKCECPPDHYGVGCAMKCERYCNADDIRTRYCCVSKQAFGAASAYQPAIGEDDL